jgi:hypothetical protein
MFCVFQQQLPAEIREQCMAALYSTDIPLALFGNRRLKQLKELNLQAQMSQGGARLCPETLASGGKDCIFHPCAVVLINISKDPKVPVRVLEDACS